MDFRLVHASLDVGMGSPFLPTVRNTLDTKTEHQRPGMGTGIHIHARRHGVPADTLRRG
jgi:hypothetical protein